MSQLLRRISAISVVTPVLVVPVLAGPVATASAHRVHPVAPKVAAEVLVVPAGLGYATASGQRARAGGASVGQAITTGTVIAATAAHSVRGFATVGVTWAAEAGLAPVIAQVRTRSHGKWSDWQVLDSDGGQGVGKETDVTTLPRGFRAGTGTSWVGAADGVAARVLLGGPGRIPHDVQLVTIDPGTSTADADIAPKAPAGAAYASTTQPTIVSRAQWGADESKMNWDHQYSPTVQVAFIHHTDTNNTYSRADAAREVRAIYAYHAVSLGWGDIGYNFLVDRYGTIYEGRSGGIDSAVVGGHTYGFNSNTTGIALIGTYQDVTPSAAMVSSLERLLAWKLGRFYREPRGVEVLTAGAQNGRYTPGQRVTFNVISGHRDGYPTDCPGQAAYNLLPSIRAAASGILGARLVDPTASVITPDANGLGAHVHIRAGLYGTESWTSTVREYTTGIVLATASGTSTGTLGTDWDLLDGYGLLVPGRYAIRITASDGHTGALPANIVVTVTGAGGVRPLYPAGTWLAMGGWYYRIDPNSTGGLMRRRMLSRPAAASYPGALQRAITVSVPMIAGITPGPDLPYRDGMLLRGVTSGSFYVMSAGQKRPIPVPQIAQDLGYTLSSALAVPDDELARIPTGADLAAGVHPIGSYVRDSAGDVFVIITDSTGALARRQLASAAAVATWTAAEGVVNANSDDLALPIDGWVRGVADGFVVQVPNVTGTFVMSLGLARRVDDRVQTQLRFSQAVVFSGADIGHPVGQLATEGSPVGMRSTTLTVAAFGPGLAGQAKSWTTSLPGSPPAGSPAGEPAR